MIAPWMLYTLIVAALGAAAATLGEHALRWAGVGGRWAWVAALAFSLALPATALFHGTAPTPASEIVSGNLTVEVPGIDRATALDAAMARARALVGGMAAALTPPLPESVARWNSTLAALWAVGAAAALLRLALLATRLHRVRRRWPRATVLGERVMVAEDVGPAVAGLDREAIVLPRWAIDADPELVRLMVAHEREHVRGRDPWLLLGGALAVALVPWNLVLHWQIRRLRRAVELDCDARVLRHHPDVRRYGALLLAVGARAPRLTTLPLAAMADRSTTLERRLRAMTTPRPRFRTALALGAAVPTLLLVAVACETPRPSPLEPENRVSAAVLASGSGTDTAAYVAALAPDDDLRTLIAAAAARGTAGAPVYVFRDTAGAAISVQPAVGELNPDDIASIEVVKGAAATRLFGEGASGGVINIYMKDGITPRRPASGAASGAATQGVLLAPSRSGTGRKIRIEGAGTDTSGAATATVLLRGAPAGLQMRKMSSAEPLYVVDGVILAPGTDISTIDPESIASIEVLKGESAKARYGARGEDGVVLITTKGK